MSSGETPFLIRPVRPEEYEPLGDLLVAAFDSLPSMMPEPDDYNRQLRDVRPRAETACELVAVTPAGELLGGVTYVRGPENPYSQGLRQDESGMRMLGVDPARQGAGVGRALTEACLQRARADGRARLRLYTGTWMLAAQHLYEQLGFERVPELDYAPHGMLAYVIDLRPPSQHGPGPSGYPAVVSSGETTFLVRPVRPEEYEALGELTVAAYHAIEYEMPHQAIYDVQLRDVARRATTSCVLVATTPAGELLGGVTYVSGPEDPYSEELREGEAGIRMLAVDLAAQRRGVGRALTVACLERARAEGRCRMVLHTADFMPAAVRLYERLGFSRAHELDFSPAPGIDLIAYALDLV